MAYAGMFIDGEERKFQKLKEPIVWVWMLFFPIFFQGTVDQEES